MNFILFCFCFLPLLTQRNLHLSLSEVYSLFLKETNSKYLRLDDHKVSDNIQMTGHDSVSVKLNLQKQVAILLV